MASTSGSDVVLNGGALDLEKTLSPGAHKGSTLAPLAGIGADGAPVPWDLIYGVFTLFTRFRPSPLVSGLSGLENLQVGGHWGAHSNQPVASGWGVR